MTYAFSKLYLCRQKHVSALSPTPCDSSAHGKSLIYRGVTWESGVTVSDYNSVVVLLWV